MSRRIIFSNMNDFNDFNIGGGGGEGDGGGGDGGGGAGISNANFPNFPIFLSQPFITRKIVMHSNDEDDLYFDNDNNKPQTSGATLRKSNDLSKEDTLFDVDDDDEDDQEEDEDPLELQSNVKIKNEIQSEYMNEPVGHVTLNSEADLEHEIQEILSSNTSDSNNEEFNYHHHAYNNYSNYDDFDNKYFHYNHYVKINDASHEWLLKDLNLNNDKRVIDVTHILQLEEENRKNKTNQADAASNSNSPSSENKNIDTQNEKTIEQKSEPAIAVSFAGNQSIDDSKTAAILDAAVDAAVDAFAATLNMTNKSSFVDNSFINTTNTDSVNSIGKKNVITDDHKNINKLYEKIIQDDDKSLKSTDIDEEDEVIEEDDHEEEEEEDHIEEEDEAAQQEARAYKEWSKKFRSKEDNTEEDVEEIEDAKESLPSNKNSDKNRKFSKSFEVSIGDLDNMIDRVENNIKLKRNKKKEISNEEVKLAEEKEKKLKEEQLKEERSKIEQMKIVESLKEEWSNMFKKLENDYKSKLEEQQKLNDLKLNELHDAIKQSISKQQEQILQQQDKMKQEQDKRKSPNEDTNSSNPIINSSSSTSSSPTDSNKHETNIQIQLSNPKSHTNNNNNSHASSNFTSSNQSTNTIVDNAKYISNLRLELKNKHARHLNDVKEYYEKEIQELKKKLNQKSKSKNGHHLNDDDDSGNQQDDGYLNHDEEEVDNVIEYADDDTVTAHTVNVSNKKKERTKQLLKQQIMLNNELKNTNQALMNKLYDSSQHIKYLTHENCQITNKLNELNHELKQSKEKISNLEHCCATLELQVTDSIKVQDQYVREYHTEKRNFIKKSQECDELKKNIKYLQQQVESYELKLDDKDNTISRLKTKNVQLEADFQRVEIELKKLRNSSKTAISLNSINQQPYITSGSNTNNNELQIREGTNSSSVPQQLPIRNQNRPYEYSKGSQQQVSSTNGLNGPNGHKSTLSQQQLTITCNNGQTQNILSTSSSTTTTTTTASSCANKSPNTNYRSRSPSLNYKNNQSSDNYNGSNKNNSSSSITYNSNNSKQLQQHQQHLSPEEEEEENDDQYQGYTKNPYITLLNHQQQQHQRVNTNNTNYTSNKNYSQQDEHDYETNNRVYSHVDRPNNQLHQQHASKLLLQSAEKQIKYIEQLESDFDALMKHKQQLDAKLTRIPYKSPNTNMHTIRESIESELNLVEKKLASVKLELRKLNIIKTSH